MPLQTTQTQTDISMCLLNLCTTFSSEKMCCLSGKSELKSKKVPMHIALTSRQSGIEAISKSSLTKILPVILAIQFYKYLNHLKVCTSFVNKLKWQFLYATCEVQQTFLTWKQQTLNNQQEINMRNVNERIKYTNSVCQECKLKHRVLYSLKHYSLRLLGKTPTSDTVK